ncbi:hypothetical protein [Pontibacillus yanchengensis]|uniref:Uncharacterized protein n=1 Tax=Pontibacillus yanchengensis Y32 TaxID=1385514 RepID=A0A0A2TD42_9BACI|nr:hypothetical protein [Pontibacillus yanchengensis]KGP73757.1 hypothetical protein N782_02425 [Pontibacillus yanchengensis Y32]
MVNEVYSSIKETYNLPISPIENENEFMLELVVLSNIGLKGGDKTSAFHDKTTRLLEFVLRKEDEQLALLITVTLINIRGCCGFYVTDNATNVRLLCDLVFIQFSNFKNKIYWNVMNLINNCEGNLGQVNLESVLKSKINRMDGNLYECFHFPVLLELFHTYLILNQKNLTVLYTDMSVDWGNYEERLSEVEFEKLLWYSFLLDEEATIKELVLEYNTLIKSDRWGIKFYRYIERSIERNQIDADKINRGIKKFESLGFFSKREYTAIGKKIRKKTKTKKSAKNKYDIKVAEQITRLSPYNLPVGVQMPDINEEISIRLVVFKDRGLTEKLKTIVVNDALTDSKRKVIYVNKPTLRGIKERAKPGFIHLIDKSKNAKKEKQGSIQDERFQWPSTDISDNEYENENLFNNFNTKSNLRKLGYQITNTTKDERWYILQKAVPKMGLKDVAYTIARNVKLRKGQKGGHQKFSYAISQWEYDLKRLKDKYYRKDFKWPNT